MRGDDENEFLVPQKLVKFGFNPLHWHITRHVGM